MHALCRRTSRISKPLATARARCSPALTERRTSILRYRVCNTRPDYACILSKLIESLLLACHSRIIAGGVHCAVALHATQAMYMYAAAAGTRAPPRAAAAAAAAGAACMAH
eukprot:COSAG01_NODE_2534_length_7489_cov_17.264953_7_plen_111_part_00